MGNFNHFGSYYGDLIHRPNEQDLKDVAAFVDDVMKKLMEYPYYEEMLS